MDPDYYDDNGNELAKITSRSEAEIAASLIFKNVANKDHPKYITMKDLLDFENKANKYCLNQWFLKVAEEEKITEADLSEWDWKRVKLSLRFLRFMKDVENHRFRSVQWLWIWKLVSKKPITNVVALHLLSKIENDSSKSHLSLDAANQESSGVPIEMGCSWKDYLADAHRHCAEPWFKTKATKPVKYAGQFCTMLLVLTRASYQMIQMKEISL